MTSHDQSMRCIVFLAENQNCTKIFNTSSRNVHKIRETAERGEAEANIEWSEVKMRFMNYPRRQTSRYLKHVENSR